MNKKRLGINPADLFADTRNIYTENEPLKKEIPARPSADRPGISKIERKMLISFYKGNYELAKNNSQSLGVTITQYINDLITADKQSKKRKIK